MMAPQLAISLTKRKPPGPFWAIFSWKRQAVTIKASVLKVTCQNVPV